MRRVGVVLLAAGLAGFLFASRQKSQPAWETARWLLAGTALIGLVFVVLPGPSK